ncbi:hypothetical protein R5R35_008784 [Gryllus longicercus]|uniref:Uncharacterized protein n=1 Tax=Gryllus longicercus TaxID=2509291 RepID=A0AAN9ZHP4_9ORTH
MLQLLISLSTSTCSSDFCLALDTASDGRGCDNMTAVIDKFLPILSEANSSDLPNTSISTATNKRPASPTENTDS